MKKAIAILLSLMIVVSSSIVAVNAENIKDIFGTNDVSSPLVIMDDEEELPELSDSRDSSNLKGATNLFTIGDISYSSTYHSYNDQSYYTGSANKSSRDQIDYRLTIQATIVASASATTGNFIVPLDYIYDTSGSYYSSPNTPYFKNFKYKVGDGAENSATIQTGKIAGTEGTSKYISIPLSSPQNMESELNIYITCDFEMKHIANVKKNTMFFKNFYVTSGSDVVASKEYALNSWHSNVISYHYFNSQVIKPKHIYRGLEIGKISERVELSFDDFSFDSYNQIPMLDTDYPLVQTITVSKGAQITLDSKIASKYTVTGSVANGWTITRKFNATEIINAYTELTSNPICGSSVTSISNSTPFECTINVPSDQKDITEINISNKIIAYTKEYGSTGEISTKNISLTVLDPIQDLDGSAGMNESTYSYSLDLNNTSDEVSFGSIRYLRSNGMLDIPDVSVTWFNDSSFPARIKSVKNIWRTNCPADLSIVITNGSTRKTVTKNDVAYNSSITFGTEASNDVVLASNEWIESIKSTPYYIDNGTKVYAIKYDQRSTSSNCFNFTFGLPLNKKNLATGATIVDNDCSKFSYELSYRYIYNGDQEDTLYNNTDYNSATGMAKFRKENAYYLIYTTGHPAYGAYVQVTNNNDITQLGQSGDQTKKINSNLYVFNSAKDNSATEANITSYNKNIIENTKWHNPLLTVVFPRGVKLDTSSNVLSRQSDTVYKYTIEENRSDNVITDTVVTLTKVKEENNQETWRISIPCVLRRLDRSSVSPTTSHSSYITYMPLPLVLNSKAYAGSQLFTIYASASQQPATPIASNNYYLSNSVNCFLKNNPEVKGDVISDTSNIDGDASTSQVCKISNVRAFDVSPSYDIVFSSQYKKDGVFVDVASTATALTVTADETIDFRTLIKSTGNAMLSKITITDTFPNFFSGPSTYVPGSLTIEILNADGTVKKDVKDYTLDTSTTGKIIANLGENNVLLPGETIRVTGQFKARDDIRPNYPGNNTVSIDSYIGSTKTETHTFNQPYKSEIASKDLTVRVFLDYNGNGVYDSAIDKPVKSASVKTSMTTTDDNAFANTQTITTPTVAINYGSVEYGSYRVDVSNIKDTRGYSLNNVSNRTFTITLAEVRAGGTKVFDVPITPEYYLVKFDKNATDATGTMSDQKFTFGVAQSLSLNAFSRTGYTFDSWNTKSDGTGAKYTNGQSVTDLAKLPNDEIFLYAQWTPNKSTVTVNPNGGSWTHSGTAYTESKDFTQNYNTTLTVELPTRTGYTFTGWTFGGNKNGKFSASTTGNSTYTFGAVAGKVDTITAGWTINASKVTVNPNGGIWTHSGTEYTESKDFTQNYNTTLTVELPTRTGYTFTGWTFGGDKNGKFPASTTGNSTYTFGAVAGKSDTITAGWSINTSKVTVNPNGGSWTHSGTAYTTSKDFTQNYNTTLTVELPTRTGYTFTGWTFGGDKNGKFSASTTDDSTYTFGAVAGKSDTITAGWTINTSKVTVNPNGGIWTHSGTAYTESKDFTQDYNTTLTVELPTRTGYTFTGWTFGGDKNGSFTPSETDDSTYVFGSAANKNDTITATWEINGYDLTVIPNGGKWENSEENQSFSMNYNSTKVISNPTRIGYTFIEWSLVGTGSSFVKDTKTFTMGYEKATLTAQWNPHGYIVHFDGNGATSGEMDDQNFVYDVEQNLSKNEFAKVGYTFTGWLDEAGESYTDEQLVKNLTAEDDATVNLYAQWRVHKYIVHFDGNGATSGEMKDQEFIYDVAQNLTKNDFTKTGYTFTGWVDGDGTAYTDEQLVEKLTAEDGGKINLEAQWEPINYIVRFNGNGATSGEMADQTFIYDVAQNLTENVFIRTGYTFVSWNTDKEGKGTEYDDKQSVLNLASENGAIVNLYAQWTINEYKLTVVPNGGVWNDETENQQFKMDFNATKQIADPTRNGYTFTGWS
ncbi:MAG: InlB B-repeat-containing protein, partial [Clostridia bacterium]|nr:InlB B-repeat-containing protein [Clostridia bacterium]